MSTLNRPISIIQVGKEWIVELRWRTEMDGGESVCGMFVSQDEAMARSYYENACRILDCWYVDRIWEGEGIAPRENVTSEGSEK